MKMNSSFFLAIIGCALAVPNWFSSKAKPDGRIVGGKPVNIEDYPYQISLQFNGEHHCGASIISSQWALTAAHCTDLDHNSYTILSNSSFRYPNSNGAIMHRIIDITPHEGYSDNTNDVAVIKIADSFIRDDSIAAIIKLADSGSSPVTGALAAVSGWGQLSAQDGSFPDQLQAVELPIAEWSECVKKYATVEAMVDESMICADPQEGDKSPCHGDSGGPLVIDGVQVGIVSFGRSCHAPGFPAVYSNVAYLRDWIKKNTDGV